MRRLLIAVAGVLVIAMAVFPPWERVTTTAPGVTVTRPAGYHPIYAPPASEPAALEPPQPSGIRWFDYQSARASSKPRGAYRKHTMLSDTGAMSVSSVSFSTSASRYFACSQFCSTKRPYFATPCSLSDIQTLSARNPRESWTPYSLNQMGPAGRPLVRCAR